MSVSADTLRALMAAGVNGEALLTVVESIDRDMAQTLAINGIPVDLAAEKRRAYDRERKAKKAAEKRSAEIPPENSTGFPPETAEITLLTKDTSSCLSVEEKEEPKKVSEETSPKKQKRNSEEQQGTRLPLDWQPTAEQINFAISEGYTEQAAYREADKFRDYWHAQPGAKGRKSNWNGTWRNWIRGNSDGFKRHNSSPAGANFPRSGNDQKLAAGLRHIARIDADGRQAAARDEANDLFPSANDLRSQSTAGNHGRSPPGSFGEGGNILALGLPQPSRFGGSR